MMNLCNICVNDSCQMQSGIERQNCEFYRELKRCPFCGGESEMYCVKHIPKGIDYTPRCKNPSCAGRISKKWLNKKDAIEAWNRRVDDDK